MNPRTEALKKQGLGKRGYNFTPHCSAKERARRLTQILSGKLDVPPEVRGEAVQLYHEVLTRQVTKAAEALSDGNPDTEA